MTIAEFDSRTSQLHDGPKFFKPLLSEIKPLKTTLLDIPKTKVTAFPIFHHSQIPDSLLEYMNKEFNDEIERGDTYAYLDHMTKQEYTDYWFQSFCVVLLATWDDKIPDVQDSSYWKDNFLGTFYIKPNYAPRCSHNCNGAFIVNHSQRGKRIGQRLAQVYMKWAPILGYKYSVFNLVFETNVASWKLWDKFNFTRIGVVPGAAILKGHEDEPVDAIIFGKDLTKIEPEFLKDL